MVLLLLSEKRRNGYHSAKQDDSGDGLRLLQEHLGHSSIAITLDTYSHVSPGLQEAAAKRFDESFPSSYNESVENESIEKVD